MKDKNIYLAVVLESIGLTKEYIKEYDLQKFLEDRKTQDAVIRNLELIGQALKDYGVDCLTEKLPDIPWLKIAGMRNILAHEYLGIDLTLVWGTLKKDLDMLWEAFEKIAPGTDNASKF